MKYNIFPETEKEKALIAQEYDYKKLIESAEATRTPDMTKAQSDALDRYISETTSWSLPLYQRLTDNAWTYPVCHYSDAVHTVEESQRDWFPIDLVMSF